MMKNGMNRLGRLVENYYRLCLGSSSNTFVNELMGEIERSSIYNEMLDIGCGVIEDGIRNELIDELCSKFDLKDKREGLRATFDSYMSIFKDYNVKGFLGNYFKISLTYLIIGLAERYKHLIRSIVKTENRFEYKEFLGDIDATYYHNESSKAYDIYQESLLKDIRGNGINLSNEMEHFIKDRVRLLFDIAYEKSSIRMDDGQDEVYLMFTDFVKKHFGE